MVAVQRFEYEPSPWNEVWSPFAKIAWGDASKDPRPLQRARRPDKNSPEYDAAFDRVIDWMVAGADTWTGDLDGVPRALLSRALVVSTEPKVRAMIAAGDRAGIVKRMATRSRDERFDAKNLNRGKNTPGRTIQNERVGTDGDQWHLSDGLSAARWERGEGNDPESEIFARLARAAAVAVEALVERVHIPATADLLKLRGSIEELIVTGVRAWRSWAQAILRARGVVDLGSRRVCALLEEIERRMAEPPPKKQGRPNAAAKFLSNLAAFEAHEAAKALAGKLFGLCGVSSPAGSTAEQKQLSRAATWALKASESHVQRFVRTELAKRRRLPSRAAGQISAEPTSSEGVKKTSGKTRSHEKQQEPPAEPAPSTSRPEQAGLSQVPRMQVARRSAQPVPPVPEPRAHRQGSRPRRV